MRILKKNEILMILIVAAAYNSIYSLAFMKGLYYTIMQAGLQLSHTQLGHLYSAYGLFSMFSYLCGAFFLNKFKTWKLIAGSSFIIGLLTLLLLKATTFSIMLIIFGIIGFLLGAAFYPSHLQMLHQIGGPLKQGAVFSLFYIFNGILGIFFNILGFGITSIHQTEYYLVRYLFIFFAFLNILISIIAALIFRKLPEQEHETASLSFRSVKILFGNPKLWSVILIVFSNYITFASLNYMLPFLSESFSLSSFTINTLSIFRVYLIAIIAAPIAGKITDYLRSASKLLGLSFILTAITIVIMVTGFRGQPFGTVICMLFFCLSVHMGKSMTLITIDEAQIPVELYGMAISFISFCAYSPDAFFYSLSGIVLDVAPGHGYTYIFLTAAFFALIGCIATFRLRKDLDAR